MEKRLNLLCDAGIIDRDIRDGMSEVIKMLETVYEIPVRNEQGEMAITHMANALMRSRNGEEIAPLDDELPVQQSGLNCRSFIRLCWLPSMLLYILTKKDI